MEAELPTTTFTLGRSPIRGGTMFCAGCGTSLEASDAFCRSCGAKSSPSAAPPPASPPPPRSAPPPGFPPPPRYAPPPTAPYATYAPSQTNVLSIFALVGAFVFWPAGIVCGIIARHQIRASGEAGDGMALAGIIISVAAGVLMVIFFIFFITVFSHIFSCGGMPQPAGPNFGATQWTCVNGVWRN